MTHWTEGYSQIIWEPQGGKEKNRRFARRPKKCSAPRPKGIWLVGEEKEAYSLANAAPAGIKPAARAHVSSEDYGMARSVQRLVDDHYAALYRYAYRLSGTADTAGDLTQETFCKAQAQLGQLRDPDRAKAWLFSILRNAYLHQVRADRVHRQVPLEHAGEIAQPPPEPFPVVEPEKLQSALNALPEGFRTPLILFYFEEFSYRDIAEHMALPIGTVMSRLARAKAFLRDRLLPPESRANG